MLNTEFGLFAKKGIRVYRIAKPYYLPSEIADLITVVDPLIRFPTQESRVHGVGVGATGNWPDYCGATCHGQIVPKVIQTQYNIDPAPTKPNAKSGIAVAEFQGQQFDYTDLNGFATQCNSTTYKVDLRSGTNTEAHCSLYEEACIESLLDLELASGLTQPIPLADYYSDTYSLLDWAQTVDADAGAPYVHSVSYGNDEIQQTSTSYMFQCNDEFQKVTSRGITIVFASGDQGVWGRSGTSTGKFNPDFPATSPYVFAVGGSDLTTTSTGPETCCADSGGGFSNTFSRPSWQDTAVSAYLAEASLPPAALYNASGRGYPDVSAIFGLYIPYCIMADSKHFGVAGTSAASPVVASILTLLNDIRLNAGKPTLGFANPFFYGLASTNPEAFNDITTGKNDGGHSTGFSAAKGWDPCSGIGTLKYDVLKKLV
jgi:tripeptidyl-peptidase-1